MKRNRRNPLLHPPNNEASAKAALDAEQQKRATKCMEEINTALKFYRCTVDATAMIPFDGSAPRLVWTTKALP